MSSSSRNDCDWPTSGSSLTCFFSSGFEFLSPAAPGDAYRVSLSSCTVLQVSFVGSFKHRKGLKNSPNDRK